MQLSRRLLRRSMLIGMWVAIPAGAQQGPPGPSDGDRPERSTDPQEILDNCLDHVDAAVDRCVERIESMVDRCLGQIAEALDADDVRRAVHIGRSCGKRIRGSAHRCVDHINRVCRRSARAMEENEATEEQLNQLREGCEAAKETVRAAAMQASEAIRDALPERPAGADDDGGGTDE